jgi:hypothetical protein
MEADGNGYMTQEEFAQVYSQLFVDDKPERIDEVGVETQVQCSVCGLYRCCLLALSLALAAFFGPPARCPC